MQRLSIGLLIWFLAGYRSNIIHAAIKSCENIASCNDLKGRGTVSLQCFNAGSAEAAKACANTAAGESGGVPAGATVGAAKDARVNLAVDPDIEEQKKPAVGEPPVGPAKRQNDRHRPPQWMVYTGAGVLGALQGGLAAGVLGAVAGAGVGLAAAYFYEKGDYGAAFGLMLGGIVGAALGGPVGSLVGALVGGVLGHFIGGVVF